MFSFSLTPAAEDRIQFLLSAEEESAKKFRVYVTGGGCAGFQYGFAFDKNVAEGEQVIPCGALEVVIDPISAMYLLDATVDYEVGLRGARFLVDNPNAETTCGCGSSFSVS